MNLTQFGFKNSQLILSMYLLISILGAYLSFSIGKEKLPEIPLPVFNVIIKDVGLTAEDIQTLITKPIETRMQSLDDIAVTFGNSYRGLSYIILVFKIGVNEKEARYNIQKQLSILADKLPNSASKPVISKRSVNDLPIMWLSLSSHNKSLSSVSNYINKTLTPQLQKIAGIKSSIVLGDVPREIRVELDQVALSKYGINMTMVYEAFKQKNILLPGGFVDAFTNRYDLQLDFKLKSLLALDNMIVTYREGGPIYLKDIASIVLQKMPKDSFAYVNGKKVVLMGIEKTAAGNTLHVIDEVQKLLSKIKENNQSGIKIEAVLSQATAIKDSLYTLFKVLLCSLFFAMIVVYLFLGSVRLSFLVLFVLPVSMASAVISLKLFGMSFNILTLLCFVLLVGLVIDDAIIVIENYISRMQEKREKTDGTVLIKGMKVISSSIITYGICLSIIFLSGIFTSGIVNIFVRSIAAVLVVGVVTSSIISLTLTPISCLFFLTSLPKKGFLTKGFIACISSLKSMYERTLIALLKKNVSLLILFFVSIIPMVYVLPHLNKSLFPLQAEKSELIASVKTQNALTSREFNRRLGLVIKAIKDNSNVSMTITSTDEKAHTSATIRVKLRDLKSRRESTMNIVKQIQDSLDKIIGLSVNVHIPGVLQENAQPLKFVISGPDYRSLLTFSEKIRQTYSDHPELGQLLITNIPLQPIYKLNIKRAAAAKAGLSPKSIAQAVSLYGGEIKVGETRLNNNETYDLYLYSGKERLMTPDDLKNIYVINQNGKSINLDAIASLEVKASSTMIKTFNNQPSLIMESTPSIALNDATRIVKMILKPLMPDNTQLEFIGQVRHMKQTLKSMSIAIALTILLIYFVMSSHFNSFYLPCLVISAQPIAISWVVYVLYITNIGFNIYSLLGIFLLLGLKTKNFILLVSRMEQYKKEGKSALSSVKLACSDRFRPILMTSVIILISMLPSLFTKGLAASESISMGVPIMTGVIVSTIFSLIFLPSLYLNFSRLREWFLGRG